MAESLFYLFIIVMVVNLIPVFLIYEIYHWMRRRTIVSSPLLVCTGLGFISGSLITALSMVCSLFGLIGNTGEERFLWILLLWVSLLFLPSGLASGLLIGLLYKIRGKPLLPPRK
jgi:hypothetical protein